MRMNKKLKFMLAASAAVLVAGTTVPAIVSCSSTQPNKLQSDQQSYDYLKILNDGLAKVHNPADDNVIPKEQQITKTFDIKTQEFSIPNNQGTSEKTTLSNAYGNDVGSKKYVKHVDLGNNKSEINDQFVFNNKNVFFEQSVLNSIQSVNDIQTRTFIPKDVIPTSPTLVLQVVLKTDLTNPQTYYFKFTGFKDASLEANLQSYLNYVYSKLTYWYTYNPLFNIAQYRPELINNSHMSYYHKGMQIQNRIRMIVDTELNSKNQNLSNDLKTEFIKKFYSVDIMNRIISLLNNYDTFLYSSEYNENPVINSTVILTQEQKNKINWDFFDFTFAEYPTTPNYDSNVWLNEYNSKLKFDPSTKPKKLVIKFNDKVNSVLSTPINSSSANNTSGYENDIDIMLSEKSWISKTLTATDYLKLINNTLNEMYEDLITKGKLTIDSNKKYEIKADKIVTNNVNEIMFVDAFVGEFTPNLTQQNTDQTPIDQNRCFSLYSVVSYLTAYLYTHNWALESSFDFTQLNVSVNSSNMIVLNHKNIQEVTKFKISAYNEVKAINEDEVMKLYADKLNKDLNGKQIALDNKQLTNFIKLPATKLYKETPNVDSYVSNYINDVLFANLTLSETNNSDSNREVFYQQFWSTELKDYNYVHLNISITDLFGYKWNINTYDNSKTKVFNFFPTYNPKTKKISLLNSMTQKSIELNVTVE